MAKKKKDNEEIEGFNQEEETSEKSGNRIVTIIIALILIIIWLGVFAILIKLDVGGFGSNVLRPILKDVPIINQILPAGTDEEYIQENETSYKSLSEAVKRIKELELQLASVQEINDANSDYINSLVAEVERLKTFEENQDTFQARVDEFEREVVFGSQAPSIEEYQKFYEALDPENAAELYQQVVVQLQADKKTLELAERYSKMDAEKAAATLSEMTAGDLDLVCGILTNMKTNLAAAIMQEMEPLTAAMITKKMSLRD